MDCTPDETGNRCLICGWQWTRPGPFPHRRCRAAPPKTASTDAILSQSRASAPPCPKGPGDYLHDAILRWTGESPTCKCSCRNHITQMNAWGPAGCHEHLEEIVDWLIAEANSRSWWQFALAIPGSRLFIKQLISGAIKQVDATE